MSELVTDYSFELLICANVPLTTMTVDFSDGLVCYPE